MKMLTVKKTLCMQVIRAVKKPKPGQILCQPHQRMLWHFLPQLYHHDHQAASREKWVGWHLPIPHRRMPSHPTYLRNNDQLRNRNGMTHRSGMMRQNKHIPLPWNQNYHWKEHLAITYGLLGQSPPCLSTLMPSTHWSRDFPWSWSRRCVYWPNLDHCNDFFFFSNFRMLKWSYIHWK